ncbi:MAG TPA: cyclopropane-fatty-acyl-phospholipid synthase family protein [Longimicrobiaceae bacterium]|nr:cyclopropane-fatty-acyl-phospholipid synthase family protein [Longimicrobiaceae bacterium]
MPAATPGTSRAPDPDVVAATRFLDRLFPPPRNVQIRLPDGTVLPADGSPACTLVIGSPGALRRMFRPPVETSLGEAYLSGDLEVEGDLCQAFPVVEACRTAARSPGDLLALVRLWRALPREGAGSAGPGRAPARLAGATHTKDRDRAAVQYHYDLGNDFYQLFLDPRMVYSCGYFPTGEEDLATAQELKLDHVCRKLRLRPGERLLDVGCGWGALLIHAAERYGVEGVGITLSERQRELAVRRVAGAGLDARIQIRLQDYRELEGESFDKVASIGMFEHVGRARLPEYFARIRAVLRPGGLFLNHGISREATAPRKTLLSVLLDPLNHLVVGTSPMTSSVFPDTELIALSDVNLAGERAGLEVRDVENLREHYALTLRHWITRLEANEAEAVRLVGRPTYRAWMIYFAASAHRFENGRISVNQTLFGRHEGGRVDVPLTRADLYAPAPSA